MALQTFTVNPLTYLMVEGYDDRSKITASKGFQSFYARANPIPTMVMNSESFNYDIRRGKKRISDLTLRIEAIRSLGSNRKDLVAQKYENSSNTFPSMVESGDVNWDQTLKRVFNEAPGGNLTREQRLVELLMDEANEIMSRLMPGRLEMMARDGLLTGAVPLDGTAQGYDFKRSTNNTFTPAVKWTVATATPLDDLDQMNEAIRQNGKSAANFVVMGEDAWKAFRANTTTLAESDNRRYWVTEVGGSRNITPLGPNVSWMVEAGFIHQANARTPEGNDFPIFTYPEEYQDANDAWVKYMPLKHVFMGNTEARLDRYFGPNLTMEMSQIELQHLNQKLGISVPQLLEIESGDMGVIDPRMFKVNFTVPMGAATGAHFDVETHPIYIPTEVDAFGLIEDVVA